MRTLVNRALLVKSTYIRKFDLAQAKLGRVTTENGTSFFFIACEMILCSASVQDKADFTRVFKGTSGIPLPFHMP